jgi:Flp pilus assembly protein TadB
MRSVPPSRDATAQPQLAGQSARHVSELQARRRAARRRRHLARVDLGIGLCAAAVLLIVTRGLAIAAVVALAVLMLCGVSWVVERRRRGSGRRRSRADGSSSSRPAGGLGGSSEPIAQRRRSARQG